MAAATMVLTSFRVRVRVRVDTTSGTVVLTSDGAAGGQGTNYSSAFSSNA
jgi:hypothetical protein